jgi:hypothetical protein
MPETTAKKIGKGIVEAVSVFTPSFARGLITLGVTIPTIIMIGQSFMAISPYVISYFQTMAPYLVMMLNIFIASSLIAFTIGVVRRLI